MFVPGDILIENGKIAEIRSAADRSPAKENAGTLDLNHKMYAVPGFIDLHTHGAAGVDVNAADTEGLGKISRFFASQGTTSWLASILTDTEEQTLWCIKQAVTFMESDMPGAQLAGIHLEGPFLAAEYKGAMPESLLKAADPALFCRYQEAARGAIRYLTVAPEVAGIDELINKLSGELTIALGHSGADYETTMRCIKNGASAATHSGNAMKLTHQHAPAILGAVLESDIYCELICDGLHLHPGIVRLILKTKGLDRAIAVTDSIMAAGLPDGDYHLGVNNVKVTGGDAVLAATGVRAGSTLTMIRALKNLISFTGLPLEKILPLMTGNPARLIRLNHKKGALLLGYDADLTILDEQLDVAATIVCGQLAYDKRLAESGVNP